MGLMFTPITALSLLQIPREKMAQASGITNTIRQLGGSFGVAILATMLTSRINYHSQMYNQAIEPNAPAYKSYVMRSTFSNMHNLGSSRIDAMKQGQYTLIANVSKQAYIEGIDDDFLIATIITLTGIVPILLLRSKKKKIQKVLTS